MAKSNKRRKGGYGGALACLGLALGVLAFLAAGPVPPSVTEERPGLWEGRIGKDCPSYHDYALLIAGMSNGRGPLAAQAADPAFIQHARVMNQTWATFDRRQLAVMRQWVSGELAQADCTTVFYPFSGPDFVNMHTLFPQARTYLMVSLEPVGEIPELSYRNGSAFYTGLQRSLYDLLQMSFFITPKLRATLGKGEVSGTLPVLLFFLAREGMRVEDVKYWVMKPGGGIEETPAAAVPVKCGPGDIPGLRIVFTRPGATEPQTLYYFHFNLGNDSFNSNPQFVAFLEKFGPLTTFSKAASYLMYKPFFSGIRQFILEKSGSVLQSDSAIPVQYFDPAVWNFCFYGCYKGPIALFSNRFQRDLAAIYQHCQDVRPLPFGICYRHRPRTANLMFAVKKTGAAHCDLD